MTLVQLTGLGPSAPATGGRREVTLLSGFLGSGKTTLLRSERHRSGASAPAVILNDFAGTMVDDELLGDEREQPVVISGGCACCTRRDELAQALADLLDAEQRGAAPRRDRVVIETSGLSDPGPIAFTVAHDPVLKHHYSLARVCVTIDAVNGLGTIERHEVALRQLLAADDLLVTKADLADAGAVEALIARLRQLNPSAGVTVTANGKVLRVEVPASLASPPAAPGPYDDTHAHKVSTLELRTEEALDWEAFSIWLSLLLHEHGPDVLRVKGVLDIQHVGHVAINGVQHVIHRPEHLQPGLRPGTRIVLIVRDLDPEILRRSFHAFLGIN